MSGREQTDIMDYFLQDVEKGPAPGGVGVGSAVGVGDDVARRSS